MEEGDTVVVSPEALLRQMLYGNLFFAREFGKTSSDFMLPDSFGFPAVLPTLVAHAGLKGFSTQKLTWLSSAPVGGPNSPERTPEGIPFNVGVWEGLDGSGVVAALNPEPYTSVVAQDITFKRGRRPIFSRLPVAAPKTRSATGRRASSATER